MYSMLSKQKIVESGLVGKFLKQGGEYMCISNIDNLEQLLI